MRLVFAGHEMDLRRQELRRADGEVVHVEPQVFDLLVHLVRNRDRVVSKDELFETIWQGRIVSEAALSSRINAARKAIGDDGDRQELIRTIHRRGFRFVGEARELEDPDGGAASGPSPAETVAAVQTGPAAGGGRADAGVASPPLAGRGDTASRKPSVVVLPVANLSQDPDTEYFAYGLTEDIIRQLAQNPWLDVLSRHTAVQFRGRDVDAREIGTALGVRYLVQASVWKRDERVRITADLICASTARQLWSERYDLRLADIFDIQSAMAQQIAAVIEPELGRVERETAARKPPGNLDAWDCYQRGLWHLWGFTTPGLAEGEAMFRRAIELDPGFARAHGGLAYVLLQSAIMRDPEERPALIEEAMRCARRAVALDERDCMNQCVLGRVHTMQGNPEEGIAALELAIQLNPSFAQGYFALGHAMIACGRDEEGIALLERATELSPRDPHLFSFHDLRATAHFSLREYEAARNFARRAVRLPNASYRPFATLAASLGQLGRTEEAAPVLEELFARKPGYSCAYARGDLHFYVNDSLVERFIEGLRLAGVPEEAVPAESAAATGEALARRARPPAGAADATPMRGR
ncbi:MAG: winged helix-turn-helix domain-containing protein [Acetobacteraceae bacterium]|nr:winged helix-turn-helix domain-containing protein [Acetobacteraceae bacterium]